MIISTFKPINMNFYPQLKKEIKNSNNENLKHIIEDNKIEVKELLLLSYDDLNTLVSLIKGSNILLKKRKSEVISVINDILVTRGQDWLCKHMKDIESGKYNVPLTNINQTSFKDIFPEVEAEADESWLFEHMKDIESGKYNVHVSSVKQISFKEIFPEIK